MSAARNKKKKEITLEGMMRIADAAGLKLTTLLVPDNRPSYFRITGGGHFLTGCSWGVNWSGSWERKP